MNNLFRYDKTRDVFTPVPLSEIDENEITQLRAENARLRAALETIASASAMEFFDSPEDFPIWLQDLARRTLEVK